MAALVLVALGGALVLAGCADGGGLPADDPADAVEGTLSAISIFQARGSGTTYFLRPTSGGAEVPLAFDGDPDLTTGVRLRVWGSRQGDDETGPLHADRYEMVDPAPAPDEVRRSALVGAPVSLQQTVAWVQMDVNGGGVNQTAAQASALIFDQNAGPLFGTKKGDLSVVQYYDQNSYGTWKLSGAVEGPIPFTGTACNNFDPLAADVVAKVTAMGRTYDHYYLYWGSEQSCGPGWGAQGTRAKPGKYVWLNNDGTFCTATGQEIGHNFGMMHASTMDCGASSMMNDTTNGCTSSEYGNPMTVMGGGCRHLIAIEKWYDQMFQGCNAVKVRSSGTFTLLPIEIPCGGIQALQIPMSTAAPTRTTTTDQSTSPTTLRYYYLELRGGQGMDGGMKTGVYVHVADDIPAPSKNGPRTFLLDMNPTTSAFDPMSSGQTFTDPAGGVSFTVTAVSTTQATIQVDITGGTGANACMDGSTLQGPGPASCNQTTGSGGSGGEAGSGGAGGSGGSVAGRGGGSAGAGERAGSGGAGRGGGSAGSAGGAGRGGSGGLGRGGGAAGAGGAAGSSAGAGGRGGNSAGGSGGTVSATGTAGTAGTAGATAGRGGTTPAAGEAGRGGAPVSTGVAGSGGVVADAGPPSDAGGGETGSSGCSCDLAPTAAGNFAGLGLICGALALARRRRRR